MVFEAEVSLAILDHVPAPEQIRAFWNAKVDDVLAGVPAQDRLWLGRTRAITPDEPRSPGRAGRVFDLIYLKGTTPDYTAPLLTAGFVSELVDAFATAEDGGLLAIDQARLEAFLRKRVGRYIVVDG